MTEQSEAAKIMNGFMDSLETLMGDTAKKLEGVDRDAMTLGELEALSARSDNLQEQFEKLGV